MARISLALGLLLLVALSEVYEVKGSFLLRHYMRKFPRRSRDFRPFACNGMLKFVDVLELKCPLKPQYKSFFGNLRSYMNFINSASGSTNFDSELKGKAQGLHSAISAMTGKGGASGDSGQVMDTLLSMGKTLGGQKESGSTVMSFGQRKELIMSMAKWARTIGQFVASAAAKNGNNIDISSLGIDGIDASAAGSADSTATGGTTGTATGGTSGTATGGTTGTATGSYGTAAGGSNTAAGGSNTAAGSVSGSYGASSGGTTKSSGNVGSPTTSTSSCTTSACANGGGSSFQGSMNFQQGSKASTQSRSQQAASAQSQQTTTSDGSS